MSSVKEVQRNLAQLIYSISDPDYLGQLQESVRGYLSAKPQSATGWPNDLPPWQGAILQVKPLPSFGEIVREQHKKPLLFADFEPTIVDITAAEDYTLEDLLIAVK